MGTPAVMEPMMPVPTTFLLVRHGHTDANGGPAGMRLSGWTDTPLSSRGEEDARRVAAALQREHEVVALYSSPLRRALHTAAPIAEVLGLTLQVEDGLREIFCGEVDGESVAHVQARYAEFWTRNLQERWEDFRWPGGESYREFRARCLWTLRRLAGRHPGDRVIVVTHAGFISQVLGWTAGVSCARWSALRPANGAVSRLAWDRGPCRVEAFDEQCHLDPSTALPTPPPRGG